MPLYFSSDTVCRRYMGPIFGEMKLGLKRADSYMVEEMMVPGMEVADDYGEREDLFGHDVNRMSMSENCGKTGEFATIQIPTKVDVLAPAASDDM